MNTIKKKKILILHTNYLQEGGEDIAVKNEIYFLEKNFEVESLFFSNKNGGFIAKLFSLILFINISNYRIVKKKIESFNPDIIYIHNTWFQMSLSIFWLIKKYNRIALVKLHNYRILCTMSYLQKNHLNNRNICPACGMLNNNSIFNKYYTNSYLKSLFIVHHSKKLYKILKNNKIKIMALNNFQIQQLKDLGLQENNIFLFPNFLNFNQIATSSDFNYKYYVYAGRVSKEKGVEELIISFLNAKLDDCKLKIVGDGPDRNTLEQKYSSENIVFLNQLNNQQTLQIINGSLGVLTATKLYEVQPNVLCEASTLKIPCVFPNSGGMKEYFPVNYPYIFKQYDYEDLTSKIKKLYFDNDSKKLGIENFNFLQPLLNEKSLISKFENAIK
jgi:glycosyltransferase involved in cell wall biosynthesis